MEIEYLIITKRDEEFCADVISFENLLSVDTSLNINRIEHSITDVTTNFGVKYKLECYDNQDRSERVFDLLLSTASEDRIDEFGQIARKIRKVAVKINSELTISTIRNDLGRKKSIEAYPILFDVENLMRRLIYRFMFINVGMKWVKEALSDDIKKSMDSKSRSSIGNYLHNLDFIELSELLFQPYTNISFQSFQNKLIETADLTEIGKSLLEDITPKSNWNRYFSKVIKVDNKDFEKKWGRLYELRNLVAHNNFIETGELDQIKKLSADISTNLLSALEKLNDIKLSAEEIDMVRNSVAINTINAIDHDITRQYYPINLLKAAKMLNIGIATSVDFLNSRGFNLEAKPNTKLSSEAASELFKEYGDLGAYKSEMARLKKIGYFK